ncbi:MAG: zinc-ribbon domain-containing protein [Nannocystaceae bacterium]|nr:zinc-ribbon domain-containing protein [bacterium]
MFVRCSNCQTQFSLDDRQVGADGAAVRCAVCRYVFRVEPPERSDQAWRVQTVDGDLFEAEDLPTLRVWVREGRLHPDDTISRTGKHWIRLGDMPEFSDAFAGFPDLPEVLSSPGGGPLDTGEMSAVGPPPSFAGDEEAGDGTDAVRPVQREMSERLDMSGLFAIPEPEDHEPEETVVHARPRSPSEDTVSVGPAVVSRTSLFEDSASMVLDDLVAPEPEPEPEPVDEVEVATEIVAVTEVGPASPRRKPKHQTTKVRTVAAALDAAAEQSGVVRVLEDAEPEPDAAQPRTEAGEPEAGAGGPSMLGAVTAHVKSAPIRPITGPLSVAETEPEAPPETDSVDVPLETTEPPRPGGRPTWPLFAGLGLLCGAAVVFGIPQVRERVLGMGGASADAAEGPHAATLAEVDAAVREGTEARLREAIASAKAASKAEGIPVNARADLALAAAEARAAQAVGLRLQALHAPSSDAAFRADDAAEEAAQAFAGVDVESATPTRLARTRARVRLAQGRPEDEVLPLVPADEPELRALVVGAQLWQDAEARVPTGLISTLAGLSEPSVPARVLLATAYARGGDDVGAAGVRDALASRAPSDPSVVALLAAHRSPAAVADVPTPGTDAPVDSGEGPSEEPDETIIIKDPPKGMSIDKLIERGCDKVDNGDVSGGLKLLLRAFDRRPNDLDVLVCLGAANRKKGVSTTALRYYEKALKQSPKFMPALLGAARSATKLGEGDKALTYYRRVLAVSPGNAEAKSYVAKKNAPHSKPTPPSGASDRKPQPPSGDRKPEPPSGDRKPEPPSPARKPEPPKPESSPP